MNPVQIQDVYSLRRNHDECEVMTFCNATADHSLLYKFNGQIISDWIAPAVVFDRTKSQKISDFPIFSVHVPVFSKKAVQCMEEILLTHGQILPLKCERDEYFAYNVTTVIDAIDEEKSEIIRIPTGKIVHVTKFVLNDDKLTGNSIFKLKHLELMEVFVTGDFVERVAQNNLSGFDFCKIDRS